MPIDYALNSQLTRKWLGHNDAARGEREEQDFSTPYSHEIGFVTSLFQLCMAQCSNLLKLLDVTRGIRRSGLRQLRDSQTRFILIEGGFAHGKLETCLGIDDDLRLSVVTLLTDIGSHLVKLSENFATEANEQKFLNINLQSDELNTHLTKAKLILQQPPSDHECSSSSSDSDSIQAVSKTPRSGNSLSLRSLLHDLDLLMDLCPTLEQTYKIQQQSIPRHLAKAPNFHATPAAVPYVQVVRDKFPRATKSVVERLGEANWERHERLRHTKAEQSNFPLPDQAVAAQQTKSQFHPISTFKDSALGSSIAAPAKKAATVVSHSSFVSNKDGSDNGRFRVPNIPAGASYGEPFTCPYCISTLRTIHNRIDWKLHVFADLQAYICVYDDCPDILKTFTTRKTWFEHAIASHLSREGFQCSLCSTLLYDKDEFLSHTFAAHNVTSETSELKSTILATASRSFPKAPDELQCPLCLQSDFSKLRDFATHLGRHLEEIALCALPPDGLDTDEEEESLVSSSQKSVTNQPETHDSHSHDRKLDQNLVPGDILTAIHDFDSRAEDELTLRPDEEIELIETDGNFRDGWYLGKHLSHGGVGLFPIIYTVKAPPKTRKPEFHRRTRAIGACSRCRKLCISCDGSSICRPCMAAGKESECKPSVDVPPRHEHRRIGFKDQTRHVKEKARRRYHEHFACPEPGCGEILKSKIALDDHLSGHHVPSTNTAAFTEHQPETLRVKVYELRENDWFDRGTGFCTIKDVHGSGYPYLSVESEDNPGETLLVTRSIREIEFQKQQDTFIVWTEADGVDMALSFQYEAGCTNIWDFISKTTLWSPVSQRDRLTMDILMRTQLQTSVVQIQEEICSIIKHNLELDGLPFTGWQSTISTQKRVEQAKVLFDNLLMSDNGADLRRARDIAIACEEKFFTQCSSQEMYYQSVHEQILGITGFEYQDFLNNSANSISSPIHGSSLYRRPSS